MVIPGSENVFLEAEEINRPGTIIERKALFRGADYEIDYDRGTLNFNRPIFATELNFFGSSLVKRIVPKTMVVKTPIFMGEDCNTIFVGMEIQPHLLQVVI